MQRITAPQALHSCCDHTWHLFLPLLVRRQLSPPPSQSSLSASAFTYCCSCLRFLCCSRASCALLFVLGFPAVIGLRLLRISISFACFDSMTAIVGEPAHHLAPRRSYCAPPPPPTSRTSSRRGASGAVAWNPPVSTSVSSSTSTQRVSEVRAQRPSLAALASLSHTNAAARSTSSCAESDTLSGTSLCSSCATPHHTTPSRAPHSCSSRIPPSALCAPAARTARPASRATAPPTMPTPKHAKPPVSPMLPLARTTARNSSWSPCAEPQSKAKVAPLGWHKHHDVSAACAGPNQS